MCFLECARVAVVVLPMKTFERLIVDRAPHVGRAEIDLGGVAASVTRHPYSIEIHWVEFSVQQTGLLFGAAIDLPRFRVSGESELAQLWAECGAAILRETARELRERAEFEAERAEREFEERMDAYRIRGA